MNIFSRLPLCLLLSAIWIAIATTSSTARADLLAYEGFDYTPGAGNLNGASGGTGWSGNWNAPSYNVIDASVGADPFPMTYPGLPTTGNRVTLDSGTRYVRGIRNFDVNSAAFAGYTEVNGDGDTVIGADGTSIWASFLLQGAGGNSQGNHVAFTDDLVNNRSGVVNIGHTNGAQPNPKIGLWIGTSGNQIAQEVETGINQDGTAQLMLVEFIFGAGNQDTVNLWVDPDATGDPNDFILTATLSGDDYSFYRMILDRADTRGDVFGFDEFRIGETVYDVLPNALNLPVPEPASALVWSLLGLAGLVWSRRRKR